MRKLKPLVARTPEALAEVLGLPAESAKDWRLTFSRAGLAQSGGQFEERNMRRRNVALRLQASLLEEAKRVAEAEGVALNQLINVAVAEKVSALRTEDYFRERAGRADIGKAKRILRKAGRGKPPLAGDQI